LRHDSFEIVYQLHGDHLCKVWERFVLIRSSFGRFSLAPVILLLPLPPLFVARGSSASSSDDSHAVLGAGGRRSGLRLCRPRAPSARATPRRWWRRSSMLGINAGTRGWGCSWGSKEEQSRPEESSSKRILLTCYWYHLEINGIIFDMVF